MVKVVDKFIGQLQEQLQRREVSIKVSETARHWLAAQGYSDLYGARNLGRLLQEKIKTPPR